MLFSDYICFYVVALTCTDIYFSYCLVQMFNGLLPVVMFSLLLTALKIDQRWVTENGLIAKIPLLHPASFN